MYGGETGYWNVKDNNFADDDGPCNLAGNWDDCISSLWNELPNCNASWYININQGGTPYKNDIGTGSSDLRPYWNDLFSSFNKCVQ